MDYIQTIKASLEPLLARLLAHLDVAGEIEQTRYFESLDVMLRGADTEESLLEFALELATAGFRGFDFDAVAWTLLDALLEEAETLSKTMSAGGRPN